MPELFLLLFLPPLTDLDRFPPHEDVRQMCIANKTYIKGLEAMQGQDCPANWGEWNDLINEAEELYRIYDALYDAQSTNLPAERRREYLQDLRDLLGVENYDMGVLPGHLPFHRFREIRRR